MAVSREFIFIARIVPKLVCNGTCGNTVFLINFFIK